MGHLALHCVPDTVYRPDGVLFQRYDSKYARCLESSQPERSKDYPCVLGSNCNIFHFPKQVSNPTTIFRNIPEGADVDISTLPGGDDDKVHQLGDLVPGFEHLASEDAVFEAEAV